MSKDINIFLDLDGVVADFDKHAEDRGIKKDGKLDYSKMDREWWASIPAFEGAFKFYEELESFGKVRFLTAVTMSSECHSGKADWAVKFAGKDKWALMDLIVCSKRDKPLLAKSNAILIDDNLDTINKWNEAGGIGLHFTGSFAEILQSLKILQNNTDLSSNFTAVGNKKLDTPIKKIPNKKPNP